MKIQSTRKNDEGNKIRRHLQSGRCVRAQFGTRSDFPAKAQGS